MSAYPEHDKLKAVSEDSEKLGEFLEWLGEQGYVLARWQKVPECDERLWPCRETIEQILAKRFDIDLKVLEKEKRQIIEEFKRRANAAK